MSDSFFTISAPAEAQFREKMSRFIAFAHPVKSAEEAREVVKRYQNEYHDARHVCWAYMIGAERTEWQLNDNGEPSGTAGKPILGQINSFGLTDIVIAVVRYFGGIKLGTSGLIAAYREAARLCIENADIIELHEMAEIYVTYPYMSMNSVMKICKGGDIEILQQEFDNTCFIKIRVRKDLEEEIANRLENIDGTSVDR
jgi:uncharacterized YigZ family protein